MKERKYIKIRGANEHNLKHLDIDIPRNEFVVLTGLSGSGKSSLAFDTIYAEGQRRYMESLSSYARQFLGQMEKPNVEKIEGLSPAISIDQKSTNRNPRSTVGTVTEIYDYMRLLYARIGIPHCPVCGKEIKKQTVDQMVDQIMSLPERTKIQLLAPVVRGRKGMHQKLFEKAKRSGYVRVQVDGNVYELSEEIPLDKNIKHNIEIIVDRLLREFKVEANVGKPQVAYRETAGHDVEKAEGKFVRQSGGRGQYGHAVIKLEKMEEGFGYEFVNAIVGGVVPKEYIPSIDKGIQEALNTGVIAGFPVLDVKVTLFDGSYHEVDSSEAAFKIAGSMAIKDALKKSDPQLLEPIMAVEVETPEQYMGDVMGNLSGRRGKIEGMEDRKNSKLIRAKVPLGEMFGYATDLRSQTQGRASYTMQFDSYEPAPKSIVDEVMSKNA